MNIHCLVASFKAYLLNIEGKTIIISTHIFSLIEKVCDRVGIIINGKMICSDTLENLTKESTLEDKFFEIYEKEMDERYE